MENILSGWNQGESEVQVPQFSESEDIPVQTLGQIPENAVTPMKKLLSTPQKSFQIPVQGLGQGLSRPSSSPGTNSTTPMKYTKNAPFLSPLKSARKKNVQFNGGVKSVVKEKESTSASTSDRDGDQDESNEVKQLEEEEEEALASRQARRRR